jgi:hypothetical protein
MIERAIGNWLTNVRERQYQTPFAQVLIRIHHRVIYQSTHGQLEQGKDIITIGPDGQYNAYQLKTGDIDLAEWRKIKGEISELIEMPIIHPGVNKSAIHKSFLVFNGHMTDPVRIQIDQINEDNKRKGRNYSYLNIIGFEELLQMFVEAQGSFIPTEIPEFNDFLKFYLTEGTDFLDKGLFIHFFNNLIFEKEMKNNASMIEGISSSVILTSYMLNQYQSRRNHFAIFEAWVSLYACILRFCLNNGIKIELISNTLDNIFAEIKECLINLKLEIKSRSDFFEGNIEGDGGAAYEIRKTLVLGSVAALESHLKSTKKDYSIDRDFLSIIERNIPLQLHCEYQFPYFYSIIRLLEFAENPNFAIKMMEELLIKVLRCSSHDCDEGLADPYLAPNDLLERINGLDKFEIDFREFAGNSYILGSIIQCLARRDRKQIIQENWRTISHIIQQSFMPDKWEDILLWRAEHGINMGEFPPDQQSWKALKTQSCSNEQLPKFIYENKEFMRFFILVFPHRAMADVIKAIDYDFTAQSS